MVSYGNHTRCPYGWRPFSRCSRTSTASTAITSQKTATNIPYEHITRMTAASGHWLPLQSELPEMRNTKPPLLFWQGIASTNWGSDWTLWRLRWPSVVYTLLTAGLAFLVAWKASHRLDTGLDCAADIPRVLQHLSLWRPFLTDAPSVFWLFVPSPHCSSREYISWSRD